MEKRGDAWGGVWGFVVNTDDDKKFKRGDILKAQGWNTRPETTLVGMSFLETMWSSGRGLSTCLT